MNVISLVCECRLLHLLISWRCCQNTLTLTNKLAWCWYCIKKCKSAIQRNFNKTDSLPLFFKLTSKSIITTVVYCAFMVLHLGCYQADVEQRAIPIDSRSWLLAMNPSLCSSDEPAKWKQSKRIALISMQFSKSVCSITIVLKIWKWLSNRHWTHCHHIIHIRL